MNRKRTMLDVAVFLITLGVCLILFCGCSRSPTKEDLAQKRIEMLERRVDSQGEAIRKLYMERESPMIDQTNEPWKKEQPARKVKGK